MTTPKTKKTPEEDAALPVSRTEIVDPILEEVRLLLGDLLPPDMADDWNLAVASYLETHPAMQERIHAIMSKRIQESADLPLGTSLPPTRKKADRR